MQRRMRLLLGCAGVLIVGSLSAPIGVFAEMRTFQIPAASSTPTNTGIEVPEAGVTVTCTGTANVRPSESVSCDSPGSNPQFENQNPHPFGTKLIGRVGGGPWQSLGSGPTEITGSGVLELVFNDSTYSDNSGSLTAVVEFVPTGGESGNEAPNELRVNVLGKKADPASASVAEGAKVSICIDPTDKLRYKLFSLDKHNFLGIPATFKEWKKASNKERDKLERQVKALKAGDCLNFTARNPTSKPITFGIGSLIQSQLRFRLTVLPKSA